MKSLAAEIQIGESKTKLDINNPRHMIRVAESQANLTPEERKTILGFSIMYLVHSEPENFSSPSKGVVISIMWEQSQMVARMLGNTIPDLDANFLIECWKKIEQFSNK